MDRTPGSRSGIPFPENEGARAPAGDAGLVARLQRQDPAAFEELVRLYEVKAFNLARGLTRNDEDARDVLQEAFLSVFVHIRSFKEQSSLSTWIYRITANAALMRLRKRKHDDRSVPIDDGQPKFDDSGHRVASLPDWNPRADEILLNRELGHLLKEAVLDLEPDYRTVFVLRDQEGLSNEEVAEVLGLSVAAVKSRLHRARLFLRERVKRYVRQGR